MIIANYQKISSDINLGNCQNLSNKLLMLIVLICGSLMTTYSFASQLSEKERLEKGKQLAFAKSKGNCLACHIIPGGDQPGNIAPPLLQMTARYPDKKTLRKRIWDATEVNPETLMPPYGRNKILTEEEIDLVVDFILSK